MSLSVQHLQEPVLLFGGGHPAPDPKTGISLFGPYSGSTNQITVAVIGDATTVDQVGRLLSMCASKVSGPTKYPLWTQDFPGFRKDGPFSSEFVTKTEWLRTLRTQDLDDLDRVQGLPNRIGRAVDLVCAEISKLKEREESPAVFVCAPPRRMMDLCLPLEGDCRGGRGRKSAADRGQVRALVRPPGQKSLAAFFPEIAQLEEGGQLSPFFEGAGDDDSRTDPVHQTPDS
jgi:hypothetical protein